jgi:predicted permease
MLTESFLLSFMGGIAGVAASFATIGFILRFIPSNIPRLNEVNIDWAVLAFALLISLFTGLLFGLAPAFQAAKSTLASSLREGSRGSGYSAKTGRLRDALMVSELALAVVLMVGAGLLLRTLGTLLEEDPGFNPSQVIAASIWLPVPNDPKADPYLGLARQNPFNRELLRRMSAIPGVELAGLTSNLPAGNPPTSNVLIIEDRPAESVADLHAEVIRVSPDYFRVIEASLVRGRYFTQNDDERKPAVAIVDEATARRHWKDREPLARRLRLGSDPAQPWITVVGILSNIKHDGLDTDGIPHTYVSAYQNAGRDLNVVLRTRQPAAVLEPQIRREIQSIDPGLPVFHVSSMNDLLDASLASHRFSAELVSGFASVGLLLASVGIYGLLAYMVGQRTREIGLRMALGAQRGDIVRMVAMKGVILAAAGIATGVLLSVTSASMMAGLLYGVRPHDPSVFVVVPLVLFVVAVLASYLPARRATKADLMLALREA